MLAADQLTLAIDIQTRSYKLLRWVADAIEKGFIPPSRAHEYANIADATLDWLEQHYLNLPPETRPDRQHLQEYANFFCTYVMTSFDVIENPGVQVYSYCGCYCPWCKFVGKAPHLKAKKLKSCDKKRAANLMVDRVIALALEERLELTIEQATEIAHGKATRRSAGYSTYGHWLINRMQGHTDGKSLLALWREIAYLPTGSPRKNFSLCHKDFADAEEMLLDSMQTMLREQ